MNFDVFVRMGSEWKRFASFMFVDHAIKFAKQQTKFYAVSVVDVLHAKRIFDREAKR